MASSSLCTIRLIGGFFGLILLCMGSFAVLAEIGAVLIFVAFLAAAWTFPIVAMLILPPMMFLVPENEEHGNCTIIESKGAYTEKERIRSNEQVCESICMNAHIDNVDGHDILCQFESESTFWEKSPS